MKQKSRSYYKRKADRLFSELVRSRPTCEMCGSSVKIFECAHVISRSNLHLRYDPQNALKFCKGCHYRWHREPLQCITWFQGVYPESFAYLMKEKDTYETNFDYPAIIKKLEHELTR